MLSLVLVNIRIGLWLTPILSYAALTMAHAYLNEILASCQNNSRPTLINKELPHPFV